MKITKKLLAFILSALMMIAVLGGTISAFAFDGSCYNPCVPVVNPCAPADPAAPAVDPCAPVFPISPMVGPFCPVYPECPECPEPMIEKVTGVAGLNEFNVTVGGLIEGWEYYIIVKDGDETVAESDHFTKNGEVPVYCKEGVVLEGEKPYVAELYFSFGSQSCKIAELEFSVPSVIIEHISTVATLTEADVFIGGIEEAHSYFVEIYDADGKYVGCTEFFDENGKVKANLLEGIAFEKGTYTAKLFYRTTGSHSCPIYELEFDVPEIIIQHVSTVAGLTEADVFIGGIDGAQSCFVEIYDADGKYIGCTEFFDENGKVKANLLEGSAFKKGNMYTAKLFYRTTGSQSCQIYELKFDVAEVIIEHVGAVIGQNEAEVVVNGIPEGHDYYINIYDKDGKLIGTSETFRENGKVKVALKDGVIFEENEKYTAELFYKLDDGTGVDLYSLNFNARGAKAELETPKVGDKEVVVNIIGVPEGQEYILNLYDGDKNIGCNDGFITKDGKVIIRLRDGETIQPNKDYKVVLSVMNTGSKSTPVQNITFNVKSDSPVTSDNANTMLWLCVALSALALISGAAVAVKKTK